MYRPKIASPVCIAAAGTGGHILPALHIAQEFRQRGHDVLWIGSHHGLENDIVPEHGFQITRIRMRGVRGKGPLGWMLGLWVLTVSLVQTARAFFHCRPKLTVAMGGYVSLPVGIVSFAMRVPLTIHEQNAKPGMSNQILSFLSTNILCGFTNTFSRRAHAIYTGNPVNTSISRLRFQQYCPRGKKLRLLVMGGSQGALIFNRTVPKALQLLPESIRPQVFQLTGKGKLKETRKNMEACGVQAQLAEFENDMQNLYRWCDLVLCRAGALTVSEIIACARPAIFIPYPSVDNHQKQNLATMEAQKLAYRIDQPQLMPNALSEKLYALHLRRDKLIFIHENIKRLQIANPAKKIVDICLSQSLDAEMSHSCH